MANIKWRLIGLLVLGLGFLLGFQNPADATPLALETSRIYGVRQIDTAIKVSQTGWQHANTVLLANSDHFPDALVAAPLSHQLDAPILLTPAGGIDEKVLQEIKRLGASRVIILGGRVALSQQTELDAKNAGLSWERIAGYDQFETAQKVAERVGAKGKVILVSGEQFPDALSIAAYAGATETPILLTEAKRMPEVTWQAITSLQRKGDLETIVVGGEAVVSSATLSSLKSVQRIFGNDRYETAANVYEFARDVLTSQTTYLVTGENFPDALAAGGLAAKQRAGIVMAQRAYLPGSTYSVLSRPTESPMNVVIIGGLAVVTDQIKNIVEGTVQPPYLLAGVTIVVDPGHGGPDPGATGATRTTYEKNNTLAIGLKLAGLLRSAGAQVIMTRSTDVTPAAGTYSQLSDLQARTKIANDQNADLYISLHNDAFSNPEVGGTTTFYSSASPVSAQSKALASSIQKELVKAIALNDRGVKDAAFYVIKNTKMPAVLVEVGFISNPTEEQLLASPDFQQKAALGVYRGILRFKGY